ncbi:AAA family ATPase [Pseudanabaena sp. FACHB-1277]|uniref:AAA family ATPase n=1 Tax=Pseudanabaena cinerea FACHB-1277 TaxID=2949581 RepID=A0A926Z6H6_9CYAN|nr:AAA family ATPase [Pseudanabaena cinerea]MBD2150753.1 AAA family ATPase [Pseudanabaena cinerea FACHB-1277]
MSSSPSQPATDLREAYRVCEPKPLSGEDFDKYYVPLLDEDDFDAVKAIGASLFVQELGEHKTFFLAGHRGCGKTTQLNLLIKNWCSDYHVIYIEADKISNIDNFDYIDIYLLSALYLVRHISQHNIEIDSNIIEDFRFLLVRIIEEAFELDSNYGYLSLEDKILSIKYTVGKIYNKSNEDINLSTDISVLLSGIILKIKDETARFYSHPLDSSGIEQVSSYRGALDIYQREFRRLICLLVKSINQIFQESKKDYKGIAFIFDNLDRCNIDSAKKLFGTEVRELLNFDFNIIYTSPIFIDYVLPRINLDKQKFLIIALVNVYRLIDVSAIPKIEDLSILKLILLLKKRIDVDALFDSHELVTKIASYSGGNLTYLMMLIRHACLSAIGRGRKKIIDIDVSYATDQLKNHFENLNLSFKDDNTSDTFYQNLVFSIYTKKLPDGDLGLLALHLGMLLRYSNDHAAWFFPQLAVTKIDKFKETYERIAQEYSQSITSLDTKQTDYSWRNLVISEVELKNIRCFESLKVSFTEGDKPSDWFMVLGENAAGKTTLLRSIALGLCDQSDAAALKSFLSGDLVRDGADEGYIKIVLSNKDASQIPLVRSQQLHRALLSAFPTISKLKDLKNALPEELGQPSPYTSLSEQIVEMIGRANTDEKLNELIAIARQQSPDNRSLQNLDGNNQTNTYTITTTITKKSEKSETLTQKIEPEADFLWSDIFVCGYGANRTTQSHNNYEGYRTLDAVQSLFTSQVSFQDPEVVLRRRSDEVRKQIEQQLLKVLMLDDHAEYQFHYSDRGIEVEGPWGRQPLAALSDGYRSTSQWLLDFIGWAVHANRLTENGNIGGILLIDEIEQHLHPLWQRHFVQRLHEMFPNTQIIASTHTPLAASGVVDIESGLLVKLDRSHDNGVQAKLINKEELYGKRADQVLTSEAFGLVTSRNLGSMTDIDRYSELLGRTRRTEDEENELQELRGKVREGLQDGENPTERLIRSEVESAIEKVANDITPELLELELTRHLQQLSNQEV